MKLLPFERAYRLEAIDCDRCAGSGLAPRPTARMAPECWYCRGLGRRITAAGRAVFYDIAAMLGRPVLKRESRIDPRHLEVIRGEQLRAGMRVALQVPASPLRTLDDAAAADFAARQRYTLFRREFTDAEIAAAEQLMASRVDAGAVKVTAADAPPSAGYRASTRRDPGGS